MAEDNFSGTEMPAGSSGDDGGLVGNLGDAASALWDGAGHAVDAAEHLGMAAVTHFEASTAAGVAAGVEVVSAGAMAMGADDASDSLHGAAENARETAQGFNAWTDRYLDRAAGDILGSDEPPADQPVYDPGLTQLDPIEQ